MRTSVLIALLCACTHARTRSAQDPWLEVRTPHFVLRTSLAEPEARRAAVQLEQMRVALLTASWHGSKEPEAVVPVVALADAAELREYAREAIAGYVSSDALGVRRIVITAESGVEENGVLKHELAHVLSEAFLLRQPRWLAEGLACYLETIRIDSRDGKVVVGEPDKGRLQFLQQHPVMDYGAVLKVGPEMIRMRDVDGYAFESSAWLLFHYLADERRPQLNELIRRLARAEDPEAAWAAAFPGYTGDQIGHDVSVWKSRGRMSTGRAPIAPWTGTVQVQPLPAAEAEAQRADLLRESLGRAPQTEKAKASALLALAADPGQPLALAVALQLEAIPAQERLARARAAASKHPDDERAWVLLIDALPGGSAERAEAAARLLALAPSSIKGLRETAWAALARGDVPHALPAAGRAVELNPGDPASLDVLALALASAGKCDEADHATRRALEVIPAGASERLADVLQKRAAEVHQLCTARLSTSSAASVARLPPRPKSCKGQGPSLVGRSKGGKVSVHFLVERNGAVSTVEKTGGDSALFGAVRSWLQGCKYEPGTEDGKPVDAWADQVFTFR